MASGTATSVNDQDDSVQEPSRETNLGDPKLYISRELSLLTFQWRVFEEVRDQSNPLLERIKFLSILASNVDELFMVRVAGLKQQLESSVQNYGADGWSPAALLEAIHVDVMRLSDAAHTHFEKELIPDLKGQRIQVRSYSDLNEVQRAKVDGFFLDAVFPVLTPLAVDPGRPFPHISNLSLNLAVSVKDGAGIVRFARVKVPAGLPQLVPVHESAQASLRPRDDSAEMTFVWIEELIGANLGVLFPGMEVLAYYPFHVTRDADIEIQELEADDLLETIEESVRQRRFGAVVRLQVNDAMPPEMLEILTTNLEVTNKDVYRVQGPLALSRLRHLYSIDRTDLKDKPFVPALPASLSAKDDDIFAAIRKEDILLHHPFYSFQPIVDFLKKAARDPDVLAIKMTLYRIGRNSPIVEALLEAMEYDKQVAVLVELKARFDEESNIEWARKLEEEGVHVVYGLMGLKIHSKVAMVVRREGDFIRRYVHLGTGNYNIVTAHLYTDLGLFTCDDRIGADVTDLFNYLTGYSAKKNYRKLLVAPVNLRERFSALILREIERHKQAGNGRLIFKMNALEDDLMIKLLYQASQAGVQIDLLVRGICCLRPGITGISDNIRVISVVGQFLEHSRIYYFYNGGDEEAYLGSADLMPRNINRRVEVVFPVQDYKMVRRLRDEILGTYLADTAKARFMQPDGTYVRSDGRNDPNAKNAQSWFLDCANARRT